MNRKRLQDAKQLLKQYFGYEDFREGQSALIAAVLNGRDVMGIMPTGAGKSMCFQIPALLLEGITLVISPLISLMKDQVSSLNQAGIHAAFLNSSLSAGQYQKALQFARQGRYKIIYVAPERLESDRFLEFALDPQVKISFLAVDEAHCVSQWGQDFRPSYLKILEFLQKLSYRPVLGAYTATATADVRDDILDILQLHSPAVVTTGFDRKNLFFAVEKPADKYRELVTYLERREADVQGSSGIIYCLTRKSVEEISYRLREEGFSVTRYHAGLSDEERRENQDDFIFDRRQIMVATNAFGMGIDKSDVRFVVHYNMPKNMESYYQEAGRAGRDGEPAECILYYEPMDVRTNRFLIEHGEDNEELDALSRQIVQERDLERLKQMTFYCFTSNCLRNYILQYFGEKSGEYCGNCQNCLTKYEETDISETTRSIFRCIKANRIRYGMTMILDILRGAKSQKIISRGLERNPEYASLSKLTMPRLRQIMNELIFEGYIEMSNDEYPVLSLQEKAVRFLETDEKIFMKLAKEEPEKKKTTKRQKKTGAVSALAEKDLEVFERLRNLRRQIASEEKVPPYIIFSDKTLVLMSAAKPHTQKEMLKISGVGEYKFQKYGERFLKAIGG